MHTVNIVQEERNLTSPWFRPGNKIQILTIFLQGFERQLFQIGLKPTYNSKPDMTHPYPVEGILSYRVYIS
jgi:hypothetical protein